MTNNNQMADLDVLMDEAQSYHGELTINVKLDSKMKLKKLQSMLDEDSITLDDITINLLDGSELKAEVLDVINTKWNDWNIL